jgi:hypothetical protein
MLYLKEAADNLHPHNFYQLTPERQHRTLDVLDRAIAQFPYLLQLPTIHQNLAEIWRITITQDLLNDILQTKVEELLIYTQSMMQELGLNPLLVIADSSFAPVSTDSLSVAVRG